ncbi:MAG: hypothetical protein EOM04_08325 [Clostridia bacterium]|nr:hypothetical protein [Clostridia bacterium]
MNNKFKITIFIFLVVLLLQVINNLGNKQEELWFLEQSEINTAIGFIQNKDYVTAKTILDRYLNNERYAYSYDFNANYAVILFELGNNNQKVKSFIEKAVNSEPYAVVEDDLFKEKFKTFIYDREDIQ